MPAALRDLLYGFGRPGQLLLHALYSPPDVVLHKGLRFVARETKNRLRPLRERARCTYPSVDGLPGGLSSRLPAPSRAAIQPLLPALQALTPLYLDHRFDLLGSGWVRVAHGESYAGFSGHRYGPAPPISSDHWRSELARQLPPGSRARTLALLAMIDDSRYRPIDWHVDYKSGHRWNPARWGRNISFDSRPGVDFKAPLELARMHHLSHLTLAYTADRDEALVREFRHQLLDFLGSNPPGWGINWILAMDAAIRAANILVARDLFLAAGVVFDEAFETALTAAMLAHGRFIVEFLEWHDHPRANHYLSDIAGLAFIAAYLPRSPETDVWLAFAVRQLGSEIDRQFTPDGAHFEASTGYHRLSAEMSIYAVALVLGLPEEKRHALAEYDHRLWRRAPALAPSPLPWPPFTSAVLSKLARAAHFARDVTKPSGDIVQIGDGDSGRFLKLSPSLKDTAGFPAERHLDVRSLIAAANGIFDTGLQEPAAALVETEIVSALALGKRFAVPTLRAEPGYHGLPVDQTAAQSATRILILPSQPDALRELERLAYPDFGLFIWRNARSFVSIRCGPIGQNGNGGHAHNDQLAVEIEIDGAAWARDPGTFIYRPDFVARNQYRSALAHFVPRHGRAEPADLVAHFRLEDRAQARVLRLDQTSFLGTHQGFGFPIFRNLVIAGGRIAIEDCIAGPRIAGDTRLTEHVVRSPRELADLWDLRLPFSPGYGLREGPCVPASLSWSPRWGSRDVPTSDDW